MKRDLKQYSPWTGMDEYPIHQVTRPLRMLETTDPRAMESYWFVIEDVSGELLLVDLVGGMEQLSKVG